MELPVISVSELNGVIKELLDAFPPLQRVCVRGEISNYKLYPSGHHYFTLKDAEGSLRCVLFRGNAASLRFRPENGQQVLASGRVSAYPRDGIYQLYVTNLLPEGSGDLNAAFEMLKAKLDAEGLFRPEHKKPLPRFPERIAIITSSAGAAVHDMIRILRSRYPLAKVLLLPVRVQGKEAPAEIAGAIRYANRWKIADIIITGRGGGSIEDLWAFNDEGVARAIYASDIPVISAVGHEPDVTIADYVADVRASTPSNAAERAVPDRIALLQDYSAAEDRMAASLEKQLRRCREELNRLAERRVLQKADAFLQDKRQMLSLRQAELLHAEDRRIAAEKERFVRQAAALDALSPLKVLGRGYSMAKTEAGTLLRDIDSVSAGDKIDVMLARGELRCRVEEKKEGTDYGSEKEKL